MAVLIVDPSREGQTAAAEVLQWADHRHKIEVAENAVSAFEIALDLEPGLIFCEPNLPDMRGDLLCTRLRTRLPASTFLAYTNEPMDMGVQVHVFDGIMEKPPCRFQVMSYLHIARQKKKVAANRRARLIGEEEISLFPKRSKLEEGKRTDIIVCIAEDKLKFAVPVYGEATLQNALNGMGKRKITWYALVRKGETLLCNPAVGLIDGDMITIKTE